MCHSMKHCFPGSALYFLSRRQIPSTFLFAPVGKLPGLYASYPVSEVNPWIYDSKSEILHIKINKMVVPARAGKERNSKRFEFITYMGINISFPCLLFLFILNYVFDTHEFRYPNKWLNVRFAIHLLFTFWFTCN